MTNKLRETEWFREMIIKAKKGNFEACMGMLIFVFCYPFIFIIRLFGKIIAKTLFKTLNIKKNN